MGHQQAATESNDNRSEHGPDAREIRNRIECHRKISTVPPDNLHANEAFHGKKLFRTRGSRVPRNISEAKNFASHWFIMEDVVMKYALVIAALAGVSFAMPASAEEVGVGVGVGPVGAGVTVGAGRSDYDRDRHTTTVIKEREPDRDRTVIIRKEREPDYDRKVIIDRR
jgi:hypothetical protein